MPVQTERATTRRPQARAPWAMAAALIAAIGSLLPHWLVVPPAVAAPAVAAPAVAAPAVAAPAVAAPELAPLPLDAAPPTATGLAAVWHDAGFDLLVRAWGELQTAPPPGALGGPRADLGWRELLAFYDGRLAFARVYTASEGLGPAYNDSACGNCHRMPTLGGAGDAADVITVHAPQWTGGDAVGVRKRAIAGHPAERAEGPTAQLRTPPLYGLGLLDAIPEAVRAAGADSDDRDRDGVRGRVSARSGGGVARPARFGQKANDWDLERFSAGAMVDEMGMTNLVRRDPRADRDALADPEVPRAEVARVVAFVRGLAPPPALARDAEADRGARLFAAIGCASCHVPRLGDVEGAYSDLLLHDMGEGLAGLKDGSAGPRDYRTAPLWGLRLRPLLLHDGRARDVAAAILAHGGEAQRRRDTFAALPAADRAAIVRFLATL